MTRSNGKRSNTRYNHSQPFKSHGSPHTSTYLQKYKIGEVVDIKINPGIHKGLPFKFYHGKTGRIFKISKSSLGIQIEKIIGNRKISKKINVGIEHLQKSKSNIGFIEKRISKDQIRREEKIKPKEKINLTEIKGFPKEEHLISFKNIKIITPEPYCIII